MKIAKKSYYLKIENITIPVISLKSNKPGPKVLITACMHGDEKGSNAVAKKLIKILENNLLKGELYVLPLLNPIGFKQNSRYIDKKDLNDFFPGKKDGNITEKVAFRIFSEIMQIKPDIAIDLHNDWKKSTHYALIDPKHKNTESKIYNKTLEYGKNLGIPFVLDTDNLKDSLSFQLLKNNIPSIVIELEAEADGLKILLNFLSLLKMVNYRSKMKLRKILNKKLLNYSVGPLPRREGFVKFLVNPGGIIKKGKAVAQIKDNNETVEILYSKDNAAVLSLTDSVKVKKREQVVALGVL